MTRRQAFVCGIPVALLALAGVAQEIAAVSLQLTPQGSRDILLQTTAPGEYTLTVTGPAPRLFTVPIPEDYDHNRLSVISFEVLCPAGLHSVSVFYGPLRDSHRGRREGIVSGADWVTVAVPLRQNWDRPYPVFCLDLDTGAGAELSLRGLVLRSIAQGEAQAAIRPDEDTGRSELDVGQATRTYLGRTWPGRIESVSVDRRYVRITGVTPEAGAALVELAPHTGLPSCTGGISVTTLSAQGDFQVEVPRRVDGRTGTAQDRLFARWRLARPIGQDLEPLSAAAWASDTDEAAGARSARRAVPMSKKGLAGVGWFPDVMDDLVDLGCRNISVNILLPSILRLDPDVEGSTPYSFNGREYAVREQAMEPLDRVLRFAREHGIVVSAVILIPRRLVDPLEQRVWCHPDACEPGVYALANVTTAEGVDAYAAALDLLARRYGSAGTGPGRITNWVIHSEVDEGWVWANAGRKSLAAYVDLYYRALRTAHYALRRHDPTARVFISLTHHWTTAKPQSYKPREMLELLRDCCRREGDFEWGVAYHPYPQNPQDPKPWLDSDVTYSFDTPLITMKNLEVLDAWMKRPDFRFQGAVRGLLLSEQGCNSPDLTPASQQLQAAAIAYFWHKVKDLDSVEAFHYQRWIDHAREDGLLLGLRACVPGTITTPGDKKMAWEVFRALGTAEEAGVTDFAKALIGIQDFSQVRYLDPID